MRAAIELWGREAVCDAVRGRLDPPADVLDGDPAEWPSGGYSESELRKAIGCAAKGHGRGWFKRVGLAEELGKIVIRHFEAVADTDLREKIEALR